MIERGTGRPASTSDGGESPAALEIPASSVLYRRDDASVSHNMLITLVGNIFPPIVGLISGPILAHALGVDGRGAVAAGTAPLVLIGTVATFGIPEAVTFTVARSPGLVALAAGRGIAILTVAGAFSTVAVILGRDWLSGDNPAVAQLITMASLAIIPSLLVGVFRGVASALQRWRAVALERIISSTLRLVVFVFLWRTDQLTLLSATVVIAVAPVVGIVAYLPLALRLPPTERDPLGNARAKRLFGYGLRIWIGSISGILLSRVDTTLMTPLSNTFELGLYVVAVSVSELPLIINSAVRDVTFATDSREAVDARLAASARISTVLSAVAGLGLCVSMVWWLPILFGTDFSQSVPVAAVLLVAVVAGTPGSIGGAGLSGRGRPGLRSASLFIACCINIVLLVVLVPTLGAMGAAIATLVGNIVSSNLNLLFLWQRFGLSVGCFYGLRGSDVRLLKSFASRLVRRR